MKTSVICMLFFSAVLVGQATTTNEISVAAGVTNTVDVSNYTGDVALMKTGSGTLILTGAGTYSGGLIVREGTVVRGNMASLGGSATSVGGNGIAGTADTIAVEEGATFDFHLMKASDDYKKAGYKKFRIAGSGVDGVGAICNSGDGLMGFGSGAIPELTLDGDALISGNRIFLANNKGDDVSSVRLNDHVLSVNCDNRTEETYREGFSLNATTFYGPGKFLVKSESCLGLWGTGGKFVDGAVFEMEPNAILTLHASQNRLEGTKLIMYGNTDPNGPQKFSSMTEVYKVSEELWVTPDRYGKENIIPKATGTGRLVIDIGNGSMTPTEKLSLKLKGGVEIASGRLVHNVECWPKGAKVYVRSGATLEAVGTSQPGAIYTLFLAGDGTDGQGAYVNHTADIEHYSPQMVSNLVLTADASIGGTKRFGLVNYTYRKARVDLAGHVLTKRGANDFTLLDMVPTDMWSGSGAGSIRIEEGSLSLHLYPKMDVTMPICIGSNGTLNVAANGKKDDLYSSCTFKTEELTLSELRCEAGAKITGADWPGKVVNAAEMKFSLDLRPLFSGGARPGSQRVLTAAGLTETFKPEIIWPDSLTDRQRRRYQVTIDGQGVFLERRRSGLILVVPEAELDNEGVDDPQGEISNDDEAPTVTPPVEEPSAEDEPPADIEPLAYKSYVMTGPCIEAPVRCWGKGLPSDGNTYAKVAIIVLHGWGGGISDVVKDTLRTQVSNRDKTGKEIVVYSPLFPHEKTFAGGANAAKDDGRAVWRRDSGDSTLYNLSGRDWRSGGVAQGTTMSSFAILDMMLTDLSNTRLFPNLKRIVVAGFSAGAQFVSRYIAVGKCPVRDGLVLEFMALSPSTEFRYESDWRWRYGLKDRTGYAAETSDAGIMANLTSRFILHGVGTADTKVDSNVDQTNPEATSQGKTRYERVKNFESYLDLYPDWKAMTSFIYINGMGHDSSVAYKNADVVNYLCKETSSLDR